MTRAYTITVFGAESTGKTTLSRQLAEVLDGAWIHEYARPYLERTGEDVTPSSMRAIWRGQTDLQDTVRGSGKCCIVQDTDLYSTVGYWQLPHVSARIGPCPPALIEDAAAHRSDLYLILQSNIPFEADRLRYGGDQRESSDSYWVELCRHYGLPHVVMEASELSERIEEACNHINERTHTLCVVS